MIVYYILPDTKSIRYPIKIFRGPDADAILPAEVWGILQKQRKK